jgi:hypothetical protein
MYMVAAFGSNAASSGRRFGGRHLEGCLADEVHDAPLQGTLSRRFGNLAGGGHHGRRRETTKVSSLNHRPPWVCSTCWVASR